MGIFDLLFDPDGFFREEVELKKPLWRGVIVVVITAVLSGIIASVTAPAISHAIYEMMIRKGASAEIAKAVASFTKLSVVIAPVVVFVEWLIVSALLYGLSAIFGGSGSFQDTAKVAAYSFVPSIIIFPFKYFLALIKIKIIEANGLLALQNSGVYKAEVILSLAVLAWQFMLWRYGIKHARKISDRSAIAVSGILTAALLLIMVLGLLRRV